MGRSLSIVKGFSDSICALLPNRSAQTSRILCRAPCELGTIQRVLPFVGSTPVATMFQFEPPSGVW